MKLQNTKEILKAAGEKLAFVRKETWFLNSNNKGKRL